MGPLHGIVTLKDVALDVLCTVEISDSSPFSLSPTEHKPEHSDHCLYRYKCHTCTHTHTHTQTHTHPHTHTPPHPPVLSCQPFMDPTHSSSDTGSKFNEADAF